MNADLRTPRRRYRGLLLLLPLLLAPMALAADSAVKLQLKGLKGEPRDNALASLSLEQRRRQPGLSPAGIRELHAQATEEIARALQPFGYYRPQVDAELQPPAAPGQPWRATYRVAAGPPLPVAALDIRFAAPAASDPALQGLAADFPLQVGSQLDHRRYEQGKRELLQAVQKLGYRDAEYSRNRVAVDLASYGASIDLQLNTGPRYVIGPISFEQRHFDDSWLQRYLVLQPGQPYTTEALAAQRRALGRSGYFREVEIRSLDPLPGADPAVPIRIVLGEFPANRYRGSVGWGTDTGFGVQFDWTRRYLGSRGQRFNLGLGAVEDRQRLAGDLSYIIPLQPLDDTGIEFAARHESKDLSYEDVELDEGGDTRISTNLLSTFWHLKRHRWGEYELAAIPGISLVTESYDVFEVLFGNLSTAAQQAIIDAIGPEAYETLAPDFEAVVASLNLSAKRADNRLFIRSGEYLGLELLGADESLGSNISFWQARLESWFIRPVFDDDRLLLRTALGYSEADSREVLGVNFNLMPEYYEFRAGGVRSVRGYSWESLVPAGSITGGKHLAVASVEYEYEVIPDWSVALFLDGGNAFNEFGDIDPKLGTGIGVRWRSPVGVARLDLGFPLDDADDAFQIYLTVGPEF